MEILMFLVGFLIGALCVFVLQKFVAGSQNQMYERLDYHIENAANKVFKVNVSDLSQNNKEKLEEFFDKFKERIEIFEKRAENNFEKETENFTKFDENIKHFLETGNKISQDANALVKVMKADNRSSGRWGEIVLERVLELSGLRKNEEYKIQSEMAEGRPDATIFLPEGKHIYVDSKTSFSSWDGYVNAKSDEERAICLKQFVESTKTHILGLAKRKYFEDEQSPKYVLMFIPIESCYSLMFCDDCALWDYAWKNGVMPVSPSTLLAALKIINSFYVVDRQNKNILEMARLCTSVHDKFAALLSELLKIRDNLNNSLKKLNGTGNIINQISKLEKLGCEYQKEIPENVEE